jgi:tetratricopeptide (TPR) repeat protein
LARARPSGAAQELLDPAWQMRWRVPELCLMLSDRAVAEARRTGDRGLRLRAEALALFAINRLGHGVTATARAIAAVLEAEKAGEDVASELRVELATCARWAGSHEVALRVLEPVLELERIDPMVRAHALVELAASLSLRRDGSECADALDEAERMYSSVTESNRDTNRLLRARVCTARACHHRRNGEFATALEATVTGLDLVRRLGDPAADSGEVRARLVLEQVHSLLDLGRREEALEPADCVLNQPVRAAAAGPSGWLRLALATRVHLNDGGHGVVVMLLNDAVAHAERHKLDGLLAEALSTLSYVHERGADFPRALRCLRSSYAADRRWRAAVQTARVRLLEELPALAEQVTVPPPRARQPAAPPTPIAHPVPPAPAGVPAPEQPPRTVDTGWRPGGENAREAARRLMDTLTHRAGSPDGESAMPDISVRRSGARRASSADDPPASRTSGSMAPRRAAADTTPDVPDWTRMLPRLNEPGEPTGSRLRSGDATDDDSDDSDDSDDEGFPLYDLPPAEGQEEQVSPRSTEFPAAEEDPPDSPLWSAAWHAGDGDPPVTVTAARQFADLLPENSTTLPAPSIEQGEPAPWLPESTADTEQGAVPRAAAQRPRNGSVPTGVRAEDEDARVKSLAEIRASLQRISERSRLKPSVVADDTGQAKPRHAESSRPVTESEGQERTRHGESAQDSSAEGVGAAREQVGLADLLAEALVAYETGRRGEQPERGAETAGFGPALPEPGSSTKDSDAGDPDAGDPDAGDPNAPRARHRRASRDPGSGGPHPWAFDRS